MYGMDCLHTIHVRDKMNTLYKILLDTRGHPKILLMYGAMCDTMYGTICMVVDGAFLHDTIETVTIVFTWIILV